MPAPTHDLKRPIYTRPVAKRRPAVDCVHESMRAGGPLSSALRRGQDCSQDGAGCDGSLPLTCRDALGKQKLQVARGQLQGTAQTLECFTRHIWTRGLSAGSVC